MAYRIKSLLSHKLADIISSSPLKINEIKPSNVVPFIKTTCSKCGDYLYTFDYTIFQKSLSVQVESRDLKELRKSLLKECNDFEAIKDVEYGNISYKVNSRDAVHEVVNSIISDPSSWKKSPLLATIDPLKIVVEFSSPNMAKPFHVGHLRSTLLGNFIANVNESVGHKVTRLNYLGDWGTQFGLLKYAMDQKGLTEDDLKVDPIHQMYKLYVGINKEIEENPLIMNKAREIFSEMEAGNKEQLRIWKLLRDLTIIELKKAYKEMNVHFDKYEGESMYSIESCLRVLDILWDKGKLKKELGRVVYDLPKSKVTLLKSDGSTLYLTRDLVAALERFKTYDFDRMVYVVEQGQSDHFNSLKTILRDLNPVVSDRIQHVIFGRITGMSTRKGTSVFLSELIEEAKKQSVIKREKTKTTKGVPDSDNMDIIEVLTPTLITYSFLQKKKNQHYPFSWNQTLQLQRSGNYIQYTHCRLVNLELNCNHTFNPDANCDLILDPDSVHLISVISEFDEIIYKCYETHESMTLTDYLDKLCTAINRAYKHLGIKNVERDQAESRIKLFRAAKITLSNAMKILGLQPLDRM